MSAHVLEVFLPWTVEFLKSHTWSRQLWDFVFPPEVSEICPAPVLPVYTWWGPVSVRWPFVAVFCVIGILGGFSSGASLLLSQKRGSQRVSGYFMWGFTFLWYGFMCVGALFTHCIQTDYVRVFYLMDVIATGCTGISSIGGFLCVWNVIDDRKSVWQIACLSVYSVLNILALTASPVIRDQVYVVPSAACTLFLVCHRKTFGRKAVSQELVSPDHSSAKAAEKWLDVGVIGATLALGSLLADRWLCYILGSHGSFLVWVFMGCDLALVSAYKFVTILRSNLPSRTGNLKSKTT